MGQCIRRQGYVNSLRAVFAYHWDGPPGLTGPLRLEWRFVGIRWIGIVAIAPGLVLAHLEPSQLIAAYVVLGIATVYNLVVQKLVLHHPGLIASGYLTMVGDALLNVAMVTVGGGFDSPFYYILYTVTIAAAMRYGNGPAVLMALLYTTFDALETFVQGRPPSGPFFFRNGFLVITAILAGYLREQALRAEGALEARLQQANRLNEATAMIGASLELESVLQATANGAGGLYGADAVAVLPGSGLVESAPARGVTWESPGAPSSLPAELLGLGNEIEGQSGRVVLPSGRAIELQPITRPTRGDTLAILAVAEPTSDAFHASDPDIVRSFVERVSLALEKATLYRALTQRSSDLQRAYADLARAHEELLRVDEMKTNFLANVSHEIRTPLSSIRSFSEILLTYGGGEEVEREFLTIINSESERLTRLLNDVLDITKIESGRMEWHRDTIDLAALLDETVRTYDVPIAQAGLELRREIEANLPEISGDRDRLQQVVGNLLNNAVKFTRQGSITLRAGRMGDEIHVAVVDTGIGIAVADQERIFEKFRQVGEVMTDKPKGTGLGLSICREIMEHHDGRIWVESEKGRGSTFTISLPLAARHGSDRRAPVLVA